VLWRVFRGVLFRSTPLDPAAGAAAFLVLAGALLAAAVRPAIRAARIDPMSALRSE
jgi:ABC-type antimicrobial peptide transport system permease subunit